jgi:GNAT superfamily N-acetyltransferase
MLARHLDNYYARRERSVNKHDLAEQVDSGHAGPVSYRNAEPLDWARFTSPSQLDWLLRPFARYDFGSEAAWSLSCFFIARKARRQGVMTELIKFAAGWGRDHEHAGQGLSRRHWR